MRETRNRSFVNASQIRAARGYLDWSQDDLAEASGLSIATVRKIESGHISPRGETMEAIVAALEQEKIDFTPSSVRLRGDDICVLEGEDCYMQLLDDIYLTMKHKKGEVLFLYADNSLPTEEERLALNRIRSYEVTWRFLIEEGNTHITYPLGEYRWFPKKFFKRNMQVVYGTKVAMGSHIDKSRELTTKMVIIDSPLLADSVRNLFEFIWESCRKPTFTNAPAPYD